MKSSDTLREACNEALGTFKKLKDEQYNDIQSKLEYCIGSYDYDKNPSGLIEVGQTALQNLKEVKKQFPRKVNKKVIDSLEKALN
ncbi:MAG: hypothetical protein GVY19_05245 [Bacteroidetes bacterium]|nr:hypothetical protein [Bacteroidota bacterium]